MVKKYKTSTGSNSDNFISAKKLDFKEFDLSNGLHCILYKDSKNPIVNVTVGYKVGSKDEDEGKKGMAHFFEHMMFQGSDNVKKNDHFQYVTNSGGISNAFTMMDATVYYDIMPSNKLEMALWLESDRMNSLNILEDNLSNQKSVVIEEKKQVCDNTPYGTTIHNIFENVFRGSGYESPVIGYEDDINSFTVNEAIDFHNTFYSPENSALMIAGDFEYAEAESLINKYFGSIKKEKKFIRKSNIISAIGKDIEVNVNDNISLPVVNFCYQVPRAGSAEDYAIEYFTEIIANNKSSRLYKSLVYEKRLVKSIVAYKFLLEDSGVLTFSAMVNDGADIDEVKKEISAAIKELAENGFKDEEYQKIKNQIEFENTIKYSKINNISLETIFNHLYFENVSRINDEIEKYLSVSKQDVTGFVDKFILNQNKLTLTYLPNK